MKIIKKISLTLIMLSILLGTTALNAQPAQASGLCSYYHTVRPGQTLAGIARAYGAYWPFLAQINNIYPPYYRIYPGQVLCIAYGGDNQGVYVPVNPPNYPVNLPNPVAAWGFSVTEVIPNSSVTVTTINFPSNVLFKARLGRQKGGGFEWKNLPNLDSGNGGTFSATFNIPPEFANTGQLVLRIIQEKKNGKVFQVDQWFNNTAQKPTPSGVGFPPYPYNYYPGYIPTIWIVGVQRDSNVTIRTANFPANLEFQVLMGPMGTRGFGYHVATFNSGAGGAMTLTFPIPPQLYGSPQISIRTQNQWTGYFSYNWFYNNSTH